MGLSLGQTEGMPTIGSKIACPSVLGDLCEVWDRTVIFENEDQGDIPDHQEACTSLQRQTILRQGGTEAPR